MDIRGRLQKEIDNLEHYVWSQYEKPNRTEIMAYKRVLNWLDEPEPKCTEHFDEFWRIYPGSRKNNKPKARTLFNKQTKSTQELIINHIKHRSLNDPNWIADNGKYIPGPVPFLNQHGWTDEYRTNKLSAYSEQTQKNIEVAMRTEL